MFRILVAEDNPSTQELICEILKNNGFDPLPAKDGEEALELMEKLHVDLLIVDVMMPNVDGYELTSQIRDSWEDFPILMLSAKHEPEDKRSGFLAGTDDYMTKPFDEGELVLRIRALLRRAKIARERELQVGEVLLNYDALSITRDGQSVALPPKEFYLLFKLLSYPGVIFTRLQLMDEIWGLETETDDRSVNVHICHLRERFGDYPEFDICTVRGLGYKAEVHA